LKNILTAVVVLLNSAAVLPTFELQAKISKSAMLWNYCCIRLSDEKKLKNGTFRDIKLITSY